MTQKIFGTDGMRGIANQDPITPQKVLALAMAAGRVFHRGNHRHRVVIGKDTRLSGYMLEPALTSGFVSMGMDVLLLGPMPTPAISMLTRSMRADLGVMISASHNQYTDNGIKLFAPDGYKLSDQSEREIEELMVNGVGDLPKSPDLGRARRLDDAPGRYIEFIKQSFPAGLRLDGLKIAIDCAHGAAYRVAPIILSELGAELIPMGVEPNGVNINLECGAAHPEGLAALTISKKADLGIALDGDADRLIMADEAGALIDGDQILSIIASDWHNKGKLKGPVVSTVMANLGFKTYLDSLDIETVSTKVGDRHVVEQMRKRGANIGGEPSGHIILGEKATTGDGLMAALQVLAVLVARKCRLSDLTQAYRPTPQRHFNMDTRHAKALSQNKKVLEKVKECEARLGKHGRILIRPSGTEPLLRIMVEGPEPALLLQLGQDIRSVTDAEEKRISE